MNGALQVYSIELLLFYVLALGIVLLPLRWSILCLLLAGCVEVVPPGFVAVTSVGWENAIGRLILPILLLLRLTRFRLPKMRWSFPAKAWAVLVLYAAISTFWSPFKLSGLKMAAYLAAWFVLYLVFDLAWRRHLLDQALVITAVWGSLALAFLQTYVMGNPLFGTEGRLGEFASAQFAPFTGPQSFGPFLACLVALLLFSKERRPFRSVSIGACLFALVLVGSRYSLIETGIVVLSWCLLRLGAVRKGGRLQVGRVLPISLLAIILFLGLRAVMAWAMPGSRVNQLLEVGSKPDVAEAGTFGWRLVRYERALSELSRRSLAGLAFGSGSSSGAEVAMADERVFVEDVDPNRAMHDEFLRTEYEWGFIGLGLGLALLVYATRELWVRAFHFRSLAGFAALAIIPGIFLALLVENPLAGPGTAESLGYVLILTYGFTGGRQISARSQSQHGRESSNRRADPAIRPGRTC
jgi:hypothetical protein